MTFLFVIYSAKARLGERAHNYLYEYHSRSSEA